jgi:hypothetical protein
MAVRDLRAYHIAMLEHIGLLLALLVLVVDAETRDVGDDSVALAVLVTGDGAVETW